MIVFERPGRWDEAWHVLSPILWKIKRGMPHQVENLTPMLLFIWFWRSAMFSNFTIWTPEFHCSVYMLNDYLFCVGVWTGGDSQKTVDTRGGPIRHRPTRKHTDTPIHMLMTADHHWRTHLGNHKIEHQCTSVRENRGQQIAGGWGYFRKNHCVLFTLVYHSHMQPPPPTPPRLLQLPHCWGGRFFSGGRWWWRHTGQPLSVSIQRK